MVGHDHVMSLTHCKAIVTTNAIFCAIWPVGCGNPWSGIGVSMRLRLVNFTYCNRQLAVSEIGNRPLTAFLKLGFFFRLFGRF